MRLKERPYMHKITISEIHKYIDNEKDIDRDNTYIADKTDLGNIPERPDESHKGTFGTALIIAGSKDYGGAPVLAAEAALRSGAGMVKVLTHESNRAPILARLPEAIVIDMGDCDAVRAQIKKADSIVVGPGLSLDKDAVNITELVLSEVECPLIVDADALNVIAADLSGRMVSCGRQVYFTPHIGEAARLLGKNISFIEENKAVAAKEIAEKYNIIAVLKSAHTVISDGNSFVINPTGNNGMASAGSGDVLAGIMGGLSARGLSGLELAVTAVYLHGLAGDSAALKYGKSSMLASDIVKGMTHVLKCHEL